MTTRLLDPLAERYGIESRFVDNDGILRETSADTKRALLAAMGVDTSGEGGLRAAREELRARAVLCPPVLAVRAGADLAVPLAGRRLFGPRLSWRLVLEDGETLEGGLDPGTLPVARLPLPAPLPVGYHRLSLDWQGQGGRRAGCETVLIAAPERCLLPEDLGLGRVWGLGCQVPALRAAGDLGSGDAGDLARLAQAIGREGAAFLATSPLHARFAAAPEAVSPYAPSSRRFLDWTLVAPDLLPEVAEDPALLHLLAELRAEAAAAPPGEALVEPVAAARRRRTLLTAAFARFSARHLAPAPDARGAAFLAFRQAGGAALERFCLFEALDEHQARGGARRPWTEWPAELRSPDDPAVHRFAAEHEDRLAFFAWTQWLAEAQLARAQEQARAAGMAIGLYRDLAVGVDPAGAATWAEPDLVTRGAVIGAPPDAFSPTGQSWGLAPYVPHRLEAHGLEPWLADLRANLRHAGAVRIDHVMGLKRLFWIPAGGTPADGAYVRYPFGHLAAAFAVESHRARCLVVGEDLGTLPLGFRAVLARAGILSSRVLWFERERGGGFKPVQRYSRAAVASVGTHDLPTLKGYLSGRDLDWQARLGRLSADQVAEARAQRAADARRLLGALRRAGIFPRPVPPPEGQGTGLREAPAAGFAAPTGSAAAPSAAGADDPLPVTAGASADDALTLAVHRWLARSPAALLLVQLEDLLGETEQVNLPGTVEGHPNWRRRMKVPLETFLDDGLASTLIEVLNEERPRGRPRPDAE